MQTQVHQAPKDGMIGISPPQASPKVKVTIKVKIRNGAPMQLLITQMNRLITIPTQETKDTGTTTPRAKVRKARFLLQMLAKTGITIMTIKMTLALVVVALLPATLGKQTPGTPVTQPTILSGKQAIPTVTRAIPRRETKEVKVGMLLSQLVSLPFKLLFALSAMFSVDLASAKNVSLVVSSIAHLVVMFLLVQEDVYSVDFTVNILAPNCKVLVGI
jgi:hypothetical protein